MEDNGVKLLLENILERLDSIDERLRTVENWKAKVIGVSVIVSTVVGVLTKLIWR